MAVEEVFTCNNNYFTGVKRKVTHRDGTVSHINTRQQGICTAASLIWCRLVLKKGKSVNSFDEFPPIPLMIAQMRIIRQNDSDPRKQTEMAGLTHISDHLVLSARQAALGFLRAAPSIGIFWNATHTMGFRVGTDCTEYFDIECGLYRSTSVDEVYFKMEDTTRGYGIPIEGYRLVAL